MLQTRTLSLVMIVISASAATLVTSASQTNQIATSPQRPTKRILETSSSSDSDEISQIRTDEDDAEAKVRHKRRHISKGFEHGDELPPLVSIKRGNKAPYNAIEDATTDEELAAKTAERKASKKNPPKTIDNNKYSKLASSAAKTTALVLTPSIESIAMRIVSSAASKTISRTTSSSQGSSRNVHSISSTAETQAPSFLSSLSSSLISAAVSHIFNQSSALPPLPPPHQPPTSGTNFASLFSNPLQTWPSKLSPIIQSIASMSGLNSDTTSDSPHHSQTFASSISPFSSFLSSNDLSTSSSNAQPVMYSPVKPLNPKQYSPTVTSFVNLARYVLCKYRLVVDCFHCKESLEAFTTISAYDVRE